MYPVITYKIADFNCYHLRFYFWKSINKCGPGTQGVKKNDYYQKDNEKSEN